VHVVAAVGLPFGAEGAAATAAACSQAVADGADALDVVVSLPLLANGDYPAARDELARAVAAAGSAAPEGRPVGVRAVVEACYLEPAAWRLAARLAVAAGCDGVVCATGLGPEGATPAAIEALCDELPPGSFVKAQGGIRVLADAQRARAAGADLLGVADPQGLLAELAAAPVQRRRRAER
jgi:deoxyribose-phosphate aldolase